MLFPCFLLCLSVAVIATPPTERSPATTFESRAQGAMMGSLVADALCLGSHYEYDAAVIKQAYGGKVISEYMGPGEKMGGTTHGIGWGRRNYHPGQTKGDQTDYGEYNLMMLEFFSSTASKTLMEQRPLNLVPALLPHWENRLSGDRWGAWKCTQTKQALQMVARMGGPDRVRDIGSLGGMSNAMGLRSGSLFGVFSDEDDAAEASKQLMFTHRNPEALIGGEFFTRVAHQVVFQNLKPSAAIYAVCEKMGQDKNSKMASFVKAQCEKGRKKFEEVVDPARPLGKMEFVDDLAMTSMARLWDVGKTEPIKVGKASPTEGTMPSSIYIILKYEDSLIEAARANAMVGGDNASRAVAIGMVLGAYHGLEGIPAAWRKGLNAWETSLKMMQTLPLLREADSSGTAASLHAEL